MPVHPASRVSPGGVHKSAIRVRKHAGVRRESPGDLFPPAAPEEPPAVEDEIRARLEGGSADVPAKLPHESRPALVEGVAAHGNDEAHGVFKERIESRSDEDK